MFARLPNLYGMVLPACPVPTFKHGTVRNASAPTASLIGMVLPALPVRELRLFGTVLSVLLKPALTIQDRSVRKYVKLAEKGQEP